MKGQKSYPALFWTFVMSFLAFVAALGKAFEALPKIVLGEPYLWLAEFLPELVVLLVLGAVAPVVTRHAHMDWRGTLGQAWTHRKVECAILGALVVAGLGLSGFLFGPVRDLYRIRYQRTSENWPAVRALELVRVRDYEAAQREVRKAPRKGDVGETLAMVEKDIERRLKDAETLVDRFREHKRAERVPTFEEVLMVGRAARLAPRAAHVKEAQTEARKIVEGTLTRYLAGIERLKRGDPAGAAEELGKSRTTCRGFLHQDLLIRHTQNRDLQSHSPEERGLLSYYLNTPRDKLRADLLAYPPIQLFQPQLKD
jgi:hypothetical protein